MIDPLARATLAAAAVLACILARRRAEHRPIAIALVFASALDATRALVPMPASLNSFLYLAHPALSIWCTLRILGRLSSLRASLHALAWPLLFSVHPFIAALWIQLVAAASWAFRDGERGDVTAACVLILIAGDAAALLGPLAWDGRELWWIVQGQGLLVALALGAVQARAIARA